jgi:hypothetical protein
VGLNRLRQPQPTEVFDAYWTFAVERQRIFRARLRSEDWSTSDAILARFRFTNAFRAADRVSQFLIKSVIYNKPHLWPDTWLRVTLFKMFNKIETWKALEEKVGEIRVDTFEPKRFTECLTEIRISNGTLYSAAYIMPSAQVFGSRMKHVNHVRLVEMMLKEQLPERLQDVSAPREAFHLLISYPSIGPFLAYQLLTDLSYTPFLDFNEAEFVCPGPGALDGLRKCFSDPDEMSAEDVIHWTMETQNENFETRELKFDDLWGRPLQLIDCQNLFCEISKYAREAFPYIQGTSKRARIKQVFRASTEPVSAWFPPKWGINDAVNEWFEGDALQPGTTLGP